jgi:hypothetical protein
LVDRQGRIAIDCATSDPNEFIDTIRDGKFPLPIRRWESLLFGFDPYLDEMNWGARRWVELGVPYAATRRHYLHLARS